MESYGFFASLSRMTDRAQDRLAESRAPAQVARLNTQGWPLSLCGGGENGKQCLVAQTIGVKTQDDGVGVKE